MAPAYLGEFEHLLLLTVLRLGATAYSTKQQFGVAMQERVNALLLPTPLGRLANVARAA